MLKDNRPQERAPLLGGTCSSRMENFWWMLKRGIELSSTFLLHQLLELTNIAMIGHIGRRELAAATLGNMMLILGGYCFTVGSSATLEKLCAQAWTGADDKRRVGLYLQRATVILLVQLVCIAVVFANGEAMLLAMGQDPELSRLAATYLHYSFFGMAAYTGFDAYRKYLLAQGVVRGSMWILAAAVPVNVVIEYTCIFGLNLGLRGAPLALTMTHSLMLASLVVYSRVWRTAETRRSWGGWSWECLDDWMMYLRQSSFNVLTSLCEMCAPEAAVLAIAYHGGSSNQTAIAAQSVLARIFMASRVLGFGLSAAAATRLGHALGRGAPGDARQTWIQGCILSVLFSLPLSVVLICTRSSFAYLFTADDQVVHLVAEALPIIAFSVLLSTLNGHFSGILRGLGRQHVSALAALVSHYLIGVPVGLLLVFSDTIPMPSVVCMWLGLGLAFLLYAVFQLFFLYTVDWPEECRRVEWQLLEDHKH